LRLGVELPFPLDKYFRLLCESVLLFIFLLTVAVALILILFSICYLIALVNRKRSSHYYYVSLATVVPILTPSQHSVILGLDYP
jgi:hypothetical protein